MSLLRLEIDQWTHIVSAPSSQSLRSVKAARRAMAHLDKAFESVRVSYLRAIAIVRSEEASTLNPTDVQGEVCLQACD